MIIYAVLIIIYASVWFHAYPFQQNKFWILHASHPVCLQCLML